MQWRLPPLAFAAIVLTGLRLGASHAVAQQEGREWLQEMRYPAPIAPDAAEAPFARFGIDAAPWVAEAVATLAAARDDNPVAEQVALLSGAGGRQYLAVTWDGDNGPLVEILAAPPAALLTADDVPPLRSVREVADDWAYLAEPTGSQPFPGEPPVVAIWHAGEAMGAIGSMRIVLLAGDTIDVSPDWAGRTLGLRDLESDGSAEIIALDESWHGFPDYCSACGPEVVVILRRWDGRSRFACTEFPSVYGPLLAWPTAAEGWLGLLAHRAHVALSAAQAGGFDAAHEAADALVQIATMHDDLTVTATSLHLLEESRQIAADVASAATAGTGSGCPLTEVTEPYAWTPWWQRR
jgi:hypothetical protein